MLLIEAKTVGENSPTTGARLAADALETVHALADRDNALRRVDRRGSRGRSPRVKLGPRVAPNVAGTV